VTQDQLEMLQRLGAKDGQTLRSDDRIAEAAQTFDGHVESLREMQALGWLELEVREAGKLKGKLPARTYQAATARLTELGRAALAEQGLRTLRVFNDKAERLNRSGFLASYRAGNRGYDRHWRQGEEFQMERHLPSEDERDAFVLTLRLFVQDRDGFSFRRIDKLYGSLPLTPDLPERIREIRRRVNRYLDAPSNIILDHRIPLRREVFDVFLYGGLAHTDPDKWAVFERWREHALQWSLVEEDFTLTATQVTQGIFLMREVNLQAIEQLESENKQSP
jgi:hypothetical protein